MAHFSKNSLIVLLLSMLAAGCSTLRNSTLAGAGYGAAVGGIAGSLVPGGSAAKPKSILIGSAAGATLGALSGALIHKSMEENEQEAYQKGKLSAASNGHGTLLSSSNGSTSRRYVPPKIERRWVDDDIRGNTLIEGHYEQVVVEEGRWE